MRDNYVGGAWTPPVGVIAIDVVNPATEEIIDQVPGGDPADVDAAVAAARQAFPGWAATPAAERAGLLDAAHTLLAGRADEIGRAHV